MHKYRPEIDGLRAVAVLAVVLFHAKLGFPGGYVGVDVFFVISGFLITSIILKAVKASEFRSLDFWERRIRRIAPALIVTIFATLVAAWFVYLPDDYVRLGNAVVAQSAFAANVYHWRASGYFSSGAEALSLLHTWSLAVEEQFYIMLPIALFLIGKWRRAWLGRSLVVAFVISLLLGIVATPQYPDASFYLLPTRAWELLLGSLLAAYPAFGESIHPKVKEWIGIVGLAAIAISIAAFDANTHFPGVAALLPCLGTAAIVWANGSGLTLVGKLLAWKPFVFVGQVSYSFYLLHWPVLVLSLYWFRDELGWPARLGLVAATFLLAVLSWAVVETPVRTKRLFANRRPLFAATIGSMIALLACGQVVRHYQGFPSRFSPQVLQYIDSRKDYRALPISMPEAKKGKFAKFGAQDGKEKILIWGDSHAMALVPALERLCKEKGVQGLGAMHPENAPLLRFVSRGEYSLKGESPEYNSTVVKYAVDQGVGTVVMAGYWSKYTPDPTFEKCLAETVATLTLAGMKVVIVSDVARHVDDVPWLLAKATIQGADVRKVGVPIGEHREINERAEKAFRRVAGPNVTILDPAPYFVDESGLWRAEFDGKAMYSDLAHLSADGALRLIPLFAQVF